MKLEALKLSIFRAQANRRCARKPSVRFRKKQSGRYYAEARKQPYIDRHNPTRALLEVRPSIFKSRIFYRGPIVLLLSQGGGWLAVDSLVVSADWVPRGRVF